MWTMSLQSKTDIKTTFACKIRANEIYLNWANQLSGRVKSSSKMGAERIVHYLVSEWKVSCTRSYYRASPPELACVPLSSRYLAVAQNVDLLEGETKTVFSASRKIMTLHKCKNSAYFKPNLKYSFIQSCKWVTAFILIWIDYHGVDILLRNRLYT